MFERQDSNSKINVFLTMEDNTVQVVPANPAYITIGNDGNIPNIAALDSSYDADRQKVSNIFISAAANGLSTDAMYTASGTVQSAENYSVMDIYDGITDKNLMEAATRAMVDCDMTPLIKEELKCAIQSKRLKEGKPEMKVEFRDPEPDLLTPEELERVEKRKVQNRMAARRFRDRQKTKGDQLQKVCQRMQSEQTRLKFELAQVKKERDGLRKAFDEHLAICPFRYQQQFYSQTDNT